MSALIREPLPLWQHDVTSRRTKVELRDAAAAENKTQPVHRWVPWIAGFSAQLVEDAVDAYLPRQGRDRALVLDPFAGVATTLVAALHAGCNVVGYEINGFAVLAARAKINCVDVPPEGLKREIDAFRTAMLRFEAYAHLPTSRRTLCGTRGSCLALLWPLVLEPGREWTTSLRWSWR